MSKSVSELEDELMTNVRREQYETCALIRAELKKRYAWGVDRVDNTPVVRKSKAHFSGRVAHVCSKRVGMAI